MIQEITAVPSVVFLLASGVMDTSTDLKMFALDHDCHLHGWGELTMDSKFVDNKHDWGIGGCPDWSGGITGIDNPWLKEKASRLLPYIPGSRVSPVLNLGPGNPDWFPWIQELPCLEGLNHQVFLNLFRQTQKIQCSLKNMKVSIFKKVST